MGLCTHWSYYDTPYGDSPSSGLLGQLGIRHIRDGLHPHERELWEKFGIKSTVILGPGDGEVAEQLKRIKENREFLDMIEGPNESGSVRAERRFSRQNVSRRRAFVSKRVVRGRQKRSRHGWFGRHWRFDGSAPAPMSNWRRLIRSIIWSCTRMRAAANRAIRSKAKRTTTSKTRRDFKGRARF